MSFNRSALPDPFSFYEGEGLKLTGRGKWRTTSCIYHGGSDSMRVNMQSGGWCCMNCGESGGDVLAYRMASRGEHFVTAARALGAWVDDGRPAPIRPAPLPARDALQILATEVNLIAIACANVTHGVTLTQRDLDRLLRASGRICAIAQAFR